MIYRSLSSSDRSCGNSPNALAVNPVTNKVYVIDGNGLDVIDGVSNTLTITTPLASSSLTAIAVNPVTNFIYITAAPGGGTVDCGQRFRSARLNRLSGIALMRKQPFSVGGELADEPDLRH